MKSLILISMLFVFNNAISQKWDSKHKIIKNDGSREILTIKNEDGRYIGYRMLHYTVAKYFDHKDTKVYRFYDLDNNRYWLKYRYEVKKGNQYHLIYEYRSDDKDSYLTYSKPTEEEKNLMKLRWTLIKKSKRNIIANN